MTDNDWPDLQSVREEAGLHLHWQGRRSYRSLVPVPRVLEQNDELSFQPKQGRNLVIEGDNLQVMVSLRTQYADAVDVVYIDPPYNRGGNDFRYSDARYHDPDADGSDATYVSNVDGGRHTKWLNYMAPRLVGMKTLMADSGVIFVSINDIELGRLLMLMDEIFDEKNRIGCHHLARIRRQQPFAYTDGTRVHRLLRERHQFRPEGVEFGRRRYARCAP